MAQSSEALILQHFRDPLNGHRKKVNVLYMNPLAEDDEFPDYRPGEISMVCFSIKKGIFARFSGIMDPRVIPPSYAYQAAKNSRLYGYHPPHENNPRGYYKAIVDIFERIMHPVSEPPGYAPWAPKPNFLFASQANIEKYTLGMKWLYRKADKPFPFRILPLEPVVQTLIDVRTMGYQPWEETAPNLNLMKKLVDPNNNRYAGMDRLNLCCDYHQGDIRVMPRTTRTWWTNLGVNEVPSEVFHRCSLLKVQKQVYLALGQLLPYYPFVAPKFGNHLQSQHGPLVHPNLDFNFGVWRMRGE